MQSITIRRQKRIKDYFVSGSLNFIVYQKQTDNLNNYITRTFDGVGENPASVSKDKNI